MRKVLKLSIAFLVLATAGSLLVKWRWSKDPVLPIAKEHVLACPNVKSETGEISDVTTRKTTYVQSAMDHSGKVTPAYNIYAFHIQGAASSILARVQVANLEAGSKDSEKYELSCL